MKEIEQIQQRRAVFTLIMLVDLGMFIFCTIFYIIGIIRSDIASVAVTGIFMGIFLNLLVMSIRERVLLDKKIDEKIKELEDAFDKSIEYPQSGETSERSKRKYTRRQK